MGELRRDRQTETKRQRKGEEEGWREGKGAVKGLIHMSTVVGQSNSISKDCILETKGSTAIVVPVQGCLSAGTQNDLVRGPLALLLQMILEGFVQFYCLQ